MPCLIINFFYAILLLASIGLLISCDHPPSPEKQIENTLELINLPANRWVSYHHTDNAHWWRKGHAGLAYDSNRGSLIIFGSDTHGEDWDNTIHEFLPKQRKWIHYGIEASKDSYRVDSDGNAIAGINQIQPWAMHTYDGVDYDPATDSILVAAVPLHNPLNKSINKNKQHPVWRYHIATKQWEIIKTEAAQKTNFFGAASAFDFSRNSWMICSNGLWTLPSNSSQLHKVIQSPKCLHRTMSYDSWSKDIYLFGDYKPSNHIYKLVRDKLTDEPVKWIKLIPTGDHCPPFSTTPVAFDQQSGVFALIVDDPDKNSNQAFTFLYNPLENSYIKLNNGKLPKVGMNFMLVWDQFHKVFFLVTGNWKEGTTVWAMRLDLKFYTVKRK